MDKITARVIIGVLIFACVLVTAFAWYKAEHDAEAMTYERVNIYDEDVQLPAPLPLDARLMLLSPLDLAKAPLADAFSAPMGDENGAFTYVAQGMGVNNAKRGGIHLGQDWNGIGGENTDEGMDVKATARGLLIYAGNVSDGWGNVVVLLHRLPDGRFVQSFYAHLKEVESLPLGTIIGRGQKLGTVGTSHGNYLAHLHFEIIESIANEVGLPGYGKTQYNRINPEKLFKAYPVENLGVPMPDPTQALLKVQHNLNWEQLMQNIIKDNKPESLDMILPAESEEK